MMVRVTLPAPLREAVRDLETQAQDWATLSDYQAKLEGLVAAYDKVKGQFLRQGYTIFDYLQADALEAIARAYFLSGRVGKCARYLASSPWELTVHSLLHHFGPRSLLSVRLIKQLRDFAIYDVD